MAATTLAAPREKGFLDRLLSLTAEVHAGEAATALLLAVNVFVLLAAYYIIKPVREVLILADQGAKIKSYSGAILAFLFLFLVPAYGAFASKFNRIRLINGVSLFFISHLVIFALLGQAGVPHLGIPFFLWISIFSLMVLAQFWGFANDLYTHEQGKRLFAIVGIGSSVGAVAGSQVYKFLQQRKVDDFEKMLVAAVLLLACLALTNLIHQREKGRAPSEARRREAEQPLGKDGGYQLVFRHRYLLFIGLLTLMINFINTNGEYIRDETFLLVARDAVTAETSTTLSGQELERQVDQVRRRIIGDFYADFQFWQNLLGALFQFFLVSRVIKYLGVRGALFIMPAISLGGYSLFAAAPLLGVIRIAKILENSTDYSLQNTLRQALFLPTSREAKYKAKQAVETFFWRAGDMLSGLTVLAGPGLAGLGVRAFATINVGMVVLWLLLVLGIAQEHRKLVAEAPVEAAA